MMIDQFLYNSLSNDGLKIMIMFVGFERALDVIQ